MKATQTGSNHLTGAIQNVTTAGTRVQLQANAGSEVILQAKSANTGSIYVGGSDVSSTVYGSELKANDQLTLHVDNANLIWLDASVSGEGISFIVT